MVTDPVVEKDSVSVDESVGLGEKDIVGDKLSVSLPEAVTSRLADLVGDKLGVSLPVEVAVPVKVNVPDTDSETDGVSVPDSVFPPTAAAPRGSERRQPNHVKQHSTSNRRPVDLHRNARLLLIGGEEQLASLATGADCMNQYFISSKT